MQKASQKRVIPAHQVSHRLDRKSFRLVFRLRALYPTFSKQRCIKLLKVCWCQLLKGNIFDDWLDMYPNQNLIILDGCRPKRTHAEQGFR